MSGVIVPLVVAGVTLAVIGVAAWMSSVGEKSRQMDAALDVLLGEETTAEDDEPVDPPPAPLTPQQVLDMSKGEIAAICQRLDRATRWSTAAHPSLRRRPSPRPPQDPYEFFADGGMK